MSDRQALRERVADILSDHRGPDNAISAKAIGQQIGRHQSTVRSLVRELVIDGHAPIGSYSDGYHWISDGAGFEREREKHLETKQRKQQRVDGLETAFSRFGPPTGRAATDGGEVEPQAPATVPDNVAAAVDALVEKHGRDDAEARLQELFNERHERAAAALGYLRYRYRGETA